MSARPSNFSNNLSNNRELPCSLVSFATSGTPSICQSLHISTYDIVQDHPVLSSWFVSSGLIDSSSSIIATSLVLEAR